MNTVKNNWHVQFGAESERLKQSFHKIDADDRDKIISTAAEILRNCPNPAGEDGRTTGLALGKVQSGKTSSFITLIGEAFDNGYKVVIVLAGTKKNLLRQNIRRIKKDFGLETRADRKIASFETFSNLSIKGSDVAAVLAKGSNVLIKVLKHHTHLEEVINAFSSANLGHYPTLIIDDEGDQASLNAKKKKRKQSQTYTKILTLRNVFRKHAYVAFTATPQANLLISTLDELSPEFCVLIEPGKGYTGGSTFHGENQKKFIREIQESEKTFEETGTIPDSLKQAISTFVVGAAIRSLRSDKEQHSMLVHISGKKSDHNNLANELKNMIDRWKQVFLSYDHDEYDVVCKWFIDGYDELCSFLETKPKWDDVLSQIEIELDDHKTWIVNSSSKGEIPDADNMHFKNNIFIGGNMLDRGVTLDGLAVTYITRWAKKSQADTVEQRARWFGYKEDYLDLCRVYMPKEVSKGFANLLGHEDDLWRTVRRIYEERTPLKQWTKRIFELDPAFKPTRDSVASVKSFPIDEGWNTQKNPQKEDIIANQNLTVIKNFFELASGKEYRKFGKIEHLFADDCDAKFVIDELLVKLFGNDEAYNIKEVLSRLVEKSIINVVDVIWIEPDGKRERTIGKNGVSLLQGYSQNYSLGDSKNYYPGDRNIHGNNVQLQVHMITPKSQSYPSKVVMLAIYFPEKTLAKTNLVMSSN